jgi:hypothetical protein
MTRVNGQLRAGFDGLDNLVHGRKIQLRFHALAVQIHGHGHDVHVAGALAIAHERTLDPVGAGHDTHLSSGDRAATIVVRMQGDMIRLSRRATLSQNHSI